MSDVAADLEVRRRFPVIAESLLFANRPVNDVVGRWLLAYPSFTAFDAYRHGVG